MMECVRARLTNEFPGLLPSSRLFLHALMHAMRSPRSICDFSCVLAGNAEPYKIMEKPANNYDTNWFDCQCTEEQNAKVSAKDCDGDGILDLVCEWWRPEYGIVDEWGYRTGSCVDDGPTCVVTNREYGWGFGVQHTLHPTPGRFRSRIFDYIRLWLHGCFWLFSLMMTCVRCLLPVTQLAATQHRLSVNIRGPATTGRPM